MNWHIFVRHIINPLPLVSVCLHVCIALFKFLRCGDISVSMCRGKILYKNAQLTHAIGVSKGTKTCPLKIPQSIFKAWKYYYQALALSRLLWLGANLRYGSECESERAEVLWKHVVTLCQCQLLLTGEHFGVVCNTYCNTIGSQFAMHLSACSVYHRAQTQTHIVKCQWVNMCSATS